MTRLLVSIIDHNNTSSLTLAIGDHSTSPFNHVELRDPFTKQWSRTTDHFSENNNSMMACLAVSDGTIVIGGTQMKNSVFLFKMEKWYSIGTLNSVCSLSALFV
jgi:hypothetical protein